jgi:uncharacterized protein YndB with AHSA1/START domain
MPVTSRSRRLGAPPEDVWRMVGDPYHLPRWWPRVERVERVEGERFTELLRSNRSGRGIRADFRVVERRKEQLLRFEQELTGTPFERVLARAETEIALAPADGGTEVAITLRQRLRGISRLGGFLFRRGTRRVLDEALDGLEAALG